MGDHEGAGILETIYREEVGHVKVGSHWFHHVCEQRGLDPESTFFELLDTHMHGSPRGPFNHDARRQAGFSERELALLDS